MSDEKKYSANFKLFNIEGLQVQFTVRADDAREHMTQLGVYLSALTGDGWRVSEPTGDLRPRTLRVAGWVRAESEDKQAGGFRPCVHLYGQHGDFKQVTVYFERLNELSLDLGAAKKWDGAAPDRASAQKRGFWNECEMEVILEPMLDYDGNPLRSEAGRVRYKFGGVKAAGHRGPSTEQQPEPTDDNPFVEEEIPVKVEAWLGTDNPTHTAKQWAVACGSCENEHEARNSLEKIVKLHGGNLTKRNLVQVLTAFYFRQQEKLAESVEAVAVKKSKSVPF